MEQYVRKYIRTCNSCQRRKKEQKLPYGELRPIEVGDPWDMIGADLWGPVKKSKDGNKYVIVATDYLSRYVEIRAIPNGTAHEVAKFIVDQVIM